MSNIFVAEAEVIGLDGMQSKGISRGHEVLFDEPHDLGGVDEGMTPGEILLNAVGGCQVGIAKMFAPAMGINLKSVSAKLRAEVDLDAVQGKNDKAKLGFYKIESKLFIDADNTDEELDKFAEFVDARCPILDTLLNPAEYSSTWERK